MTPQEAKKQYGAEFYMPMKDGVTPQMYYRYGPIGYGDKNAPIVLQYLSFANLWNGSEGHNNPEFISKLIKID